MNVNLETANDGYQSLIKIDHSLPDIISTNLVMPNMDGFQLIEALNTLPELAHSLIIVITGLSDEDINKKCDLPERATYSEN